MRKIFDVQLVALVGAVIAIVLIPVIGKENRFNAVATVDDVEYDVADQSGRLKVFKDAGAAVKFFGKFAPEGSDIQVTLPNEQYAASEAAGDPSTALEREVVKLTKEVTAANANLAKVTTEVNAATALGWNTGSAAQQAALAESTLRQGLITGLKTALNAKLVLLGASAVA